MEESSQNSDGEERGQSCDGERIFEDYSSLRTRARRIFDSNSDRARHKRRKNEKTPKQDRISAMPDAILLHILSFLPTKDVVKTGILSKRWLYHWTSIPNLDFSVSSSCYEEISSFVTFVDRTLILHKCCKVKKFVVDFVYDESFESNLDLWIRFAARANVEDLCLKLQEENCPDVENYLLPHHICSNSSIMKLTLCNCDVMPNGLINWKSLKSLSLGYLNMGDELIKKILIGSPVLEFLELYGFCGLNHLDICSASLRRLVLRDEWYDEREGDDSSILEINAPNLHSLDILGNTHGKKFRLLDVQSIVDCNLNFSQSNNVLKSDAGTDYEVHESAVRDLLDKLRHVKKLIIGDWCIQVLSRLVVKGRSFSLSKCKCLILDTCIEKYDAPGIAGLLQSSPNLETLIIDMTFTRCRYLFNENGPTYHWTSQEWSSKCSLTCLKIVEIVSFRTYDLVSKDAIQFVRFLLESARVLEKMVVKVRKVGPEKVGHRECSPKELLQVAQRLLKLPRSSLCAEIIFAE